MKIKYITNVRIPTVRAQGYAVMKMCEEFAKQGNEVELVVPNRRNNETEQDPYKYYGIQNNFKIRKISSIDLLGPFEIFGKLFYWIDILSFLFNLSFRKIYNPEDIVYTRDYLIFSVLSPKISCLELHDIPHKKFLFKHLIKKLNYIFVLNKYIKEELIKLGVSESKIYISPSGVDLKEFDINISNEEARKKLNLPIDKKIIVYTGHLYRWKGVYTLADAAKKLPQYIFLFVGGSEPELTQFKKIYYGIENIVTLPFVERSVIPMYLKSADVLVVPNSKNSDISAKYTSPLKLFEYMASNKPIVASDLPSLREVLSENICVFAKPDNVESFAGVIQNIIQNEELAHSLSEKAFNAVEHYTWKNKAENILHVIT